MGDRACVAIVVDEHVLMVRQTYRGATLWTFPGGGIEPDESPRDAAIREVREETGLDVRLGACLYQGARLNGSGVYTCFAGEIVGGAPRLGDDRDAEGRAELHRLTWHPLASMRDHPEVMRCLLHRPEGEYDLALPVRCEAHATPGASNATSVVEAGGVRYIWKHYHSLHSPSSIDYEHRLLRWLSEQELSFRVPAPIQTRAGDVRTWHIDGWRSLTPYVEGERCDARRVEHAALMGSALGELQAVLRDYPMTPRPGKTLPTALFDFPPRDPLAIRPDDLGVANSRENEALCGWWREQAAEVRAFSRGAYRLLPQQVCHNDITPPNLIVNGDELRAVLDFEFAGPSARALDLAMGLRMAMRVWENPMPWSAVRAFMGGYHRYARLTDAEIEAIPALLRLRVAMPGLWWMGRDGAAVLRSIGFLRTMTDWLAHSGDQLTEVISNANRLA